MRVGEAKASRDFLARGCSARLRQTDEQSACPTAETLSEESTRLDRSSDPQYTVHTLAFAGEHVGRYVRCMQDY